jgi:hypothetical protein
MEAKLFVIHVEKAADGSVEIIGTLKTGKLNKSMLLNVNTGLINIKYLKANEDYVKEVAAIGSKVHVIMNSFDYDLLKQSIMYNLTFSSDGKMINHLYNPKKKQEDKKRGFFEQISDFFKN